MKRKEGDPMQTLNEVLEAARRLPEDERRRCIEELEATLRSPRISEQQRRAAMEYLLSLAGTAHADVSDVSSNKYEHLAESTRSEMP
jgi:hypothetical protein